jgi:modulator of FtsH protease HflK
MAWNEPGGNKNKDPWGNRGGNDGPPDLDEVFRKFQKKMNDIFGGRTGGGSTGSDNSSFGIIVLLVIVGLLWLASGTYKIEAAERGVVLRFGKHVYTVESGLHWHFPAPFEKVLKVDVSNVSDFSHASTMLTQDQNIIDVDITVQYRIKNAENYFFSLRQPDFTLKEATESALRQHVGRSTMDYVFGDGREEIVVSVEKTIQSILDSYNSGLHIERVNMQEAKPPEAVKAAFDDVTQAEEDEVRLKNQAQAYQNEVIPTARGKAAQMTQEASAYKQEVIARAEGDAKRFDKLLKEYRKAPQVTRDRLYLETVESVLTNTSKVMVDVKGGNNMMYLPLDKMMGSRQINSSAMEQANKMSDQLTRSRDDLERPADARNRINSRNRETR